ncbi:VOC family protein [Nonomuraea sp. NPDC003804]|uniref:VOC family protein n=1 Tax=Nonomuraea sp. NPDC003804 TaxID=3154547 RepID=UPI00339F9530
MLRGLTTTCFWADDLEAAKRWYTEVFGIEPYFERPGRDGALAYVEYRIGDYQHEFGLCQSGYAPDGAATEPGGAVVYWHVDDLDAAVERLVSMGAKEYQPAVSWGDAGFRTASVVDPFGNVLGLMVNPHYLEVLASLKQ